jgi:ubiquinone/menaquinone biosynthesis C-methylase UbiE
MLKGIHRLLSRYSPESIPFPATKIYSLVTKSKVVRDFYEKVAIEVVNEISKGKILDVGTGPGYLPIKIVKLNQNLKVIGIDISKDMVEIAKSNAEKERVSDKVKFLVNDAKKILFEDSYFDLVISTASLHHWKEPLSVINEIHRVLKYGCKALIYDIRSDVPSYMIRSWAKKSGYGEILSLISYSIIKVHSSITLSNVLKLLKGKENMFKQYDLEESWCSYPIIKITLTKV